MLIVVVVLLASGSVFAQMDRAQLRFKGGDNGALGGFVGVVAEAQYAMPKHFMLRGAVEYNTLQRTAAEIRPAYFHDFDFGRLHAELLVHYAQQYDLNNVAIGAGVGLTMRYVWLSLGYYHRTMLLGGDRLTEPFNIYYELGVSCLPKVEHWDLFISVTNNRLCELERHYQPSLVVAGWWYPLKRLGVSVGASYKSAGMFNISSDYYQFYGEVGVCYKW